MNPYRHSLDKSWGEGFRVGQWVRYTGPNEAYAGKVGKVTSTTKNMVIVSMRGRLFGLQDYGCYPEFLSRVEREDIAKEITERTKP